MNSRPTTQQLRAKDAWDTLKTARTQFEGTAWEEFDGHVKRLGPRIVTAGLGPAVSFVAAKQKDDYLLLQRLAAWVLHKNDPKAPRETLSSRIYNGNSADLRRWTAEALEWLVWLKRFCDSEAKP